MNFFKKMTEYKADWTDVALIKLGVFAATLFLAKIYQPILSLEWYWYLLSGIVFSIKPVIGYLKLFKTIQGNQV